MIKVKNITNKLVDNNKVSVLLPSSSNSMHELNLGKILMICMKLNLEEVKDK